MKAEKILFENVIGINQEKLKSHHDFLPSVLKAMEEYATQSEPNTVREIMDIRNFLESQDIIKSYQTVFDKNWNEVSIESLLIAFKEALQQTQAVGVRENYTCRNCGSKKKPIPTGEMCPDCTC